MQNSYKKNSFGGNRSGGKRFGSGDSSPREMHEATCAECGNTCRVPFLPSNGRPVFCSDCFEKKENEGGESRAPRRNSFDRPQFNRPRYDKPTFSNRRETNGSTVGQEEFKQLQQKINEMNDKLDILLHSIAHKSEK